ncbi:NPC intracellular cholesterol transporter 2 homolog a-like [Macrobrachium rosenbergii]|uniref:NPC intracellular cholesterol transporter 2 homolog a-like n=1 Tax=Macrobrachium rosenbergii TaxID=79674 RepID=UPI0034D6ACB2
MNTNALIILLFATFVATSSAVNIQNCGGSASVNLNGIQITGCKPNIRRCIFVRGQDADMALPFTTNVQVTAVTAKVTGIVSFIPIPFNLPNSNGCVNSGLQCPLEPQQPQTYSASLPVLKSYPSIPVLVQWELLDQNNNKLVCIKFPVQLK